MQTNTHVGRLVRVPKLMHIGDKGTAKVIFWLALDDGQQTDFICYIAYNKLAESIVKVTKQPGTLLEVQFNIHSDRYLDQQHQPKYLVEHVVHRFKVLAVPKAKTSWHDMKDDPVATKETAHDQQSSIEELIPAWEKDLFDMKGNDGNE